VAYNDRELGRFLEALATRVPPEETLLAVTSDHGEELFDHGGVLHGYTLYEELLHVPLVLRWPGTVRPAERTEPTDALDLHATLVDLAGALGRVPTAGRSLLPLLTGREDLPDCLLFAAAPGVEGGVHAVRDGPWKLIRVPGTPRSWAMGVRRARSWQREYLFDLAADPGERRNLAGLGGPREAWLRARLAAWIQERRPADDAPPLAPEEPLDEETRRRLRALGYLD
ncbi:MAG TPA: sulfatase-like hydrolase/transferase, partial [Thermoanaerobaculia bacterium]|nr:sulfatase-like hydrolase/transferase [Thermoanaerobaculia bacterium]